MPKKGDNRKGVMEGEVEQKDKGRKWIEKAWLRKIFLAPRKGK